MFVLCPAMMLSSVGSCHAPSKAARASRSAGDDAALLRLPPPVQQLGAVLLHDFDLIVEQQHFYRRAQRPRPIQAQV